MFEITLEQVTAHVLTWEDQRNFMVDLGLIMLVQLPLFNRMIVVIVKETVAMVTGDTEDQQLEVQKLSIDINHDYFKVLRTNMSYWKIIWLYIWINKSKIIHDSFFLVIQFYRKSSLLLILQSYNTIVKKVS